MVPEELTSTAMASIEELSIQNGIPAPIRITQDTSINLVYLHLSLVANRPQPYIARDFALKDPTAIRSLQTQDF